VSPSIVDRLEGRVFASLPGPMVQMMRRVLHRRVSSLRKFQSAVDNRSGLEIGGPSNIFGDLGALPIYRNVANLDNCVFSGDTIWEGSRAEGHTFAYHSGKANGFNFIREATELRGFPNEKYDFVLSSHSLEHTSNPVKALKEWRRVVKDSGTFVIVLPDFRRTFDHRRAPTPVSHMLEDYEKGTDETDLTHLPEILDLHDLSRDPWAGTKENFYRRSLQNFENRCLHHHVFDEHNSRELLEVVGLTVVVQELVGPNNIVMLARRMPY
jgi:SAM-dependent methyltransferase